MENELIKILLIEDNPSDARLLEERLKEVRSETEFDLVHAVNLKSGTDQLNAANFDVILLDLGLPDSLGLDGMVPIKELTSSTPIVVLTGNYEDEKLAVEAVKSGAQDYLFKDQLNSSLLIRAIQYAIERKKSEEALIDARKRAETSDRLKSVFLGNMSHEVRTPLTAIIGYTDLMSVQLDSGISIDKQKKYLNTIQRNSFRLRDLIDDILDISHIEADMTVLNYESVSPDGLIKKAVSDIIVTAREKNLEIREEYNCGCYINIDKLRFQQSILNVLQNSIKYTDEGWVSIETHCANSRFVVSIADTGIGIKKEFLPYIFSQFRQEEEGPSRTYDGVGLGLSITQRLVSFMNGRIDVKSEAGKGSTFTISFPLVEPPADIDEKRTESTVEVIPRLDQILAEKGIEYRNILVLQNNIDNLNLIVNTVESLDLTPLPATTSMAALELIKKNKVSCMLVDVAIKKGMTGIEFMKAVRKMEQYINVPIVVVTAYAMKGQKEELLAQGFDDYLAKPFIIDELKSVITNALNK